MKNILRNFNCVRAGIIILTLALTMACASPGNSPNSSLNFSLPQVNPESNREYVLRGNLRLYGAEVEAWLGVLNSSGQISRLKFNSLEEFTNAKTMQNNMVEVSGTNEPDYLNMPLILVDGIRLAN